MNMNLDDPKLTAFALGELDEPEKSAIASAIADSPEARRAVDETRDLARALKNEFAAQLNEERPVPANLIDIRDDPWVWSKGRPLAIAALLALFALIGALVFGPHKSDKAQPVTAVVPAGPIELSDVEADMSAHENQSNQNDTKNRANITTTSTDGRRYVDYVGEHPFLNTSKYPRSSFPIRVNTDSYSEIQDSINAGLPPVQDSVRIEEMLNYFNFDYPQPRDENPVVVHFDVASCPWNSTHQLVRIGIKARASRASDDASEVIAKDVEANVWFNPLLVSAYRAIGYQSEVPLSNENLNKSKQCCGGTEIKGDDIASDQSYTLLYEIIPGNADDHASRTKKLSRGSLTVKLRFKRPGAGNTEFMSRWLTEEAGDFAQAHHDLKFAAAVAEFGMILRDSDYKGNGTLDAVLEWAQEGKGSDANGYRAGFIELVRKAAALKRG